MTEEEAREFIQKEIRRQMAAAGRVLVVPPAEVVRKEYLGMAATRVLNRIGLFTADEREAFRYLMAQGRTSVNRLAIVLSGNDAGATRARWKTAVDSLKDRGLADATSNGFGVTARETIAAVLAPHEPKDDEVEDVYQIVLGRLVGATA